MIALFKRYVVHNFGLKLLSLLLGRPACGS